jgi:hypothetical protein
MAAVRNNSFCICHSSIEDSVCRFWSWLLSQAQLLAQLDHLKAENEGALRAIEEASKTAEIGKPVLKRGELSLQPLPSVAVRHQSAPQRAPGASIVEKESIARSPFQAGALPPITIADTPSGPGSSFVGCTPLVAANSSSSVLAVVSAAAEALGGPDSSSTDASCRVGEASKIGRLDLDLELLRRHNMADLLQRHREAMVGGSHWSNSE